jgi:GT2 family glycosyltransferase
MFEKLPSLRGFQPKFYSGGFSRFHLPLLYDLVSLAKPARVVVLGFGDGQAFFTCCQAAVEQKLACDCVAVRRNRTPGSEDDDIVWRKGRDEANEFYGERVRFFSSVAEALAELRDGSVDLIWLDDSDSGTEIRRDLSEWKFKLGAKATVLLHGVRVERENPPSVAWNEWVGERRNAVFSEGIGLGIAMTAESGPPSFLIENSKELGPVYSLAAARIHAAARADDAEKQSAAFQIRQVWLDSLLADRWKVQEIMDHQQRTIADLEQRFEAIHEDRKKAQEIMDGQLEHINAMQRDRNEVQLVLDSQQEQISQWAGEAERLKAETEQLKAETGRLTAEIERLRAQTKDQKRTLSAAKKACRKKGGCFQIPTGPKIRRPLMERIVREMRRLPRNLRLSRPQPPAASQEEPQPEPVDKPPAAAEAVGLPSRYEAWISEHEPSAAGLEEQRRATAQMAFRPQISLLVPVHNTPANFLDEMFASVTAQTYHNWELCVVDGGSDHPETLATLQSWLVREPRIRLKRLAKNLGISENTNCALEMVTGDFIACIDHDDLLAPFALFELARSTVAFPDGDIFYSDEDRLSEAGKRHAPFFKPEWSPELLQASMYIGHLTAYRRSLVEEVGGFRKEFDLSQDYDFALRATEKAQSVRHIPHVLYHWREHPASGSIGGKPDARKSNLAALADAMQRRNLPADILEYPTANRARLKVGSWPRVSVIVPTDSPTRAQACVEDLPRATEYPDLEIVVVTNSELVKSLKTFAPPNAKVRLVSYDKPFNFSDKCNLGAEASTGERLVFFNDDVEPREPDWIQNLIEQLENSEVGAVSPKMLYETGKIQHAGLVMGVRGLAGTAFHEHEADSTEHFNLAQSLRNVAALSAACLAMRRDDFFRVGGFDAVNTPIAHSDIDLCFKVREAGMRCVYTPYATLGHAGHLSIGAEEKKETVRRRNKASIFLLKRFPRYAMHDPFFPDNMRDWLYSDSPTRIRMAAPERPFSVESSPDLLFVTHDLSLSGAPMMLLHAASWCQQNGFFVLVVAPEDGPLRRKIEEAGIPLIIDPLVETRHESFTRFARDFDCIVANTILTEAVVRAMQGQGTPVAWWLHEPGWVAEHYLGEDQELRTVLSLPDLILAPSERTAGVYRPYTARPVECIRNAIPDTGKRHSNHVAVIRRPLRFLLLGSVERRKGQDVFVEALALLPREVQDAARFQIAGRILEPDVWPKIEAKAGALKTFSVRGSVNHAEALGLMSSADVVISASRDEAMPTITLLEAMRDGKALIATNVGGADEVLADGEDVLLVRPDAPDALAAAIRRLIEDPALVANLGGKARDTYERSFTIERFGAEFSKLIRGAISAPV